MYLQWIYQHLLSVFPLTLGIVTFKGLPFQLEKTTETSMYRALFRSQNCTLHRNALTKTLQMNSLKQLSYVYPLNQVSVIRTYSSPSRRLKQELTSIERTPKGTFMVLILSKYTCTFVLLIPTSNSHKSRNSFWSPKSKNLSRIWTVDFQSVTRKEYCLLDSQIEYGCIPIRLQINEVQSSRYILWYVP